MRTGERLRKRDRNPVLQVKTGRLRVKSKESLAEEGEEVNIPGFKKKSYSLSFPKKMKSAKSAFVVCGSVDSSRSLQAPRFLCSY